MQRRAFLRGIGLAACSAAAHPMMTTVTLAGSDGGRPLGDHRLVVIILRGAMDGLDLVQPWGAAEFAGYRPTLRAEDARDLDGYFRLHPAFAGLMPMWQAGGLGFVHATSTPYRNKRSHFEGQDMLEAGTGMDVPLSQVRDGWLNRLLQSLPGLTSQTAYSIGIEAMPLLAGPAQVQQWAPQTRLVLTPQSRLLLNEIYRGDPLFRAAAAEAIDLAEEAGSEPMEPGAPKVDQVTGIVDYAVTQLRQDARIAAFSLTGWDTHRAQAHGLPRNLARLQSALLQLQTGLGAEIWGKTVVLAMTEFGRTARENGTAGTDHGTAGVMVMAGGALRGGKVYGQWPGIAADALYQDRDLAPTSDVRGWAAHVMRGLYGIDRTTLETMIFPGLDMGADPGVLL